MIVLSMEVESFKNFQVDNQWLIWVSLGLMIVSEIVVLCIPAGRRPPLNWVFLSIFTLC